MPWTILRTSLVNAMFGGAFFLYFVFGTGYMKAVGFTGNEPEYIGLIAAGFMLVFMIVGSFLADYISRRAILLTAAVVFLIFALPYFYLVNTGSVLLATVAEVIGFGFVFGFGYGAIPTFYTENFPTRYRASGASAGYQIAQVYGGGLIPIVAGQILRVYGVKDAYLYIGASGDVLRGGRDHRHSAHAGDQGRQSRKLTGGAISIVCWCTAAMGQ